MFPALSTATQSVVDGHEIATIGRLASTAVLTRHVAEAPSPGSLVVTELPLLSTATHSPADGHEIAWTMFVASIFSGAAHVNGESAFAADTSASAATAAQIGMIARRALNPRSVQSPIGRDPRSRADQSQ